jgi:hypothetical protein
MVTTTDADTLTVPADVGTVFNWCYGANQRLDELYEKAKTSQWNVSTDLDWSIGVDLEREARQSLAVFGAPATTRDDLAGTPLERWGEKEWLHYGIGFQRWNLSQFLHGEQGALLCACRIVETAPDYAAKQFAATQVVDEARHVEAFNRYLNEKLGDRYGVDPRLASLLANIVGDQRWDITYLGMQIMVEGMALAAFSMMHATTGEPLLRRMLRYVLRDEARHVGFGLLSLAEHYRELSQNERRERQEFALDAVLLLRGRFRRDEFWESMEVDRTTIDGLYQRYQARPNPYESAMLHRVTKNCRTIGLLGGADDWLGPRLVREGIPVP